MKPSFPAGASPLVYSVLGRVVLQAEHQDGSDDLPPEKLLSLLGEHRLVTSNAALNEAVAQLQKETPAEQRRRIVTLPGPGQRAQSLIALDLFGTGQAALIEGVLKLNETIRAGGGVGDQLSLLVAAPEWLLGGAPIHLGGGGPGGHPRPLRTTAPGGAGRGRRKWRIEPPATLGGLANGTGGAGVTVYMLDTAPCAHAMARAYAKWGADHELAASLLGPGSPLRVTYADYADLLELEAYGIQKHRYTMTDHGLFVAGIIHSIAPEAQLELIEVLNPYGIGTTLTIAKGLQQVARRAAKRDDGPLVVNMSLVITLPQPDDLKRLKSEDPEGWGNYSPAEFKKLCTTLEEDVRQQLEGVCNILRKRDVLLVAAAGNDAENGVRPPARLPAAFDQVTGVGAVDPDSVPAPYSNRSDRPTPRAPNMIASFGGDVDRTAVAATPRLAAENRGMLGIYIGDFPSRPRKAAPANRNGWAWWSGTSFAAPVVAGVMARLRSSARPASPSLSAAETEQAVLAEAMPSGDPNELVFPVTQP